MNGPQNTGASGGEALDAAPGAGGAPAPAPGVGGLVRLNAPLAFLKTADPMPMLRPPDLIDAGEVGEVVAVRALGVLAVRFRRGTFLIEASRLIAADPEAPDHR